MELPEHKERNYLGEKDVCEKCPECGGDTSNLPLNEWLETQEICHCTKTNAGTAGHFVTVTWHRSCFIKKYCK